MPDDDQPDDRKIDITMLEFWLKLRSAADQRTYWFLLGVSGAIIGILSQWKTVYCAGGSAKWVFLAMAIGAGCIGIFMSISNGYDSERLNSVSRQLRVVSREDRSKPFRVYKWHPVAGATWSPLLIAVIFSALMVVLSGKVSADPQKDTLCGEKEKKTALLMASDLQVHFEFYKTAILFDAEAILTRVTSYLKTENPKAQILITGAADERGSEEINLTLGLARAAAAKASLVAQGISADRIETRSDGKTRSVCTEHCEECWAKNRRAYFEIN